MIRVIITHPTLAKGGILDDGNDAGMYERMQMVSVNTDDTWNCPFFTRILFERGSN